jgi:site-specific recombinase XerD
MPWNKDMWKSPIKEAVTRANLSETVTAYTLRHSGITDLVTAGLPLLTIAQITGTSIAMIERHYGHLTAEKSQDALRTLIA